MAWKKLRDIGLSESELEKVVVRPKLLQQLLDRRLPRPLIDEQIWTLVFSYGYKDDPDKLYEVLCEGALPPKQCNSWMEMLPLPPRRGTEPRDSEGNTNIDLILGAVGKRGEKTSGIQFDPLLGSGVCLVEAKWLSDISYRTTHDHNRNQLARLIEGAVTLQHHEARPDEDGFQPCAGSSLPEDVHVTLLTPAAFTGNGQYDRLYGYKIQEYQEDPGKILADIETSVVPERQPGDNWEYPANLETRVRQTQLHWVTFEQLFVEMSPGPAKDQMREFARTYGAARNNRPGILDMDVFN